jgi:hypothetical protein
MDEQTLSQLELEEEAATKQLSIEEKRALIAEAKKRYGKDYTKFFAALTKSGSGIDWQAIKFRMQ